MISSLLAYDKPEWDIGYWWDINTEWKLDMNGEIPAELSFTENDCRFAVSSIEQRMLTHGSQSVHDAYVINSEGLLFGEGQVHVSGGPFPVTLNVRVQDTTITSQIVVSRESLGLLSWQRSFTGVLESLQGGNWEEIGEISLNFKFEWDAPFDPYRFPFEIGDSWNEVTDVFWFGEYSIAVDIFSAVQEDSGFFDEMDQLNYSIDVSNVEDVQGIPSVKIHIDYGSESFEDIWFSPVVEWNIKNYSSGYTEDGLVYITDWDYLVTDFGQTPATPEPTRTPQPPTATPTSPPPTDPPPTVTGT
ncbi:hypothetical protein JW979_00520, partial [bacterium]|nr:hypothetical protein [candidate division CSSED10-310 bacterium]